MKNTVVLDVVLDLSAFNVRTGQTMRRLSEGFTRQWLRYDAMPSVRDTMMSSRSSFGKEYEPSKYCTSSTVVVAATTFAFAIARGETPLFAVLHAVGSEASADQYIVHHNHLESSIFTAVGFWFPHTACSRHASCLGWYSAPEQLVHPGVFILT